MTASHDRRGFTLIEMVIVMTIIGIIGLAVVPAFLNSQLGNQDNIADPVANVLRAAQRAAVDSGRTVRIVVDPASGRYLATMADADSALATGTFVFPAGAAIMADSIRAQFVFEPSGRTIGDSLLISGNKGRAFVSVDPWTGGVRVRPL